MCLSVSAFSQKAKANADTTAKAYMTYRCEMHPQYVSNIETKCPLCNRNMNLSTKEQMKMENMKLFICPMDSVMSTKAGKCPKCNMDMVQFKPKQ